MALFGKGLALDKLDRFDEAVQAYDGAIGTLPKNAAIWYNKGNAFVSLEKYDSAIKCYEQAIKLNQSYAEAWYSKGVASKNLGFDVEATASFSRARELATRASQMQIFENDLKI